MTTVPAQAADAAPSTPALPARPVASDRTLLASLLRDPASFTLDAAIATLLRAGRPDEPAAIRFEAAFGLGFAAADVMSVEAGENASFCITTSALGLTGPSGALPRRYTEHVIGERRARSNALSDFLSVIAQRPIWQFIQAGTKYRPHRLAEGAYPGGEDGSRLALQALAGFAIPEVGRRLGPLLDTVLHHAGAFAGHPRSAERLQAILSDWLGERVTVDQFAGVWLRLPMPEMTRLPAAGSGQFHRLGVDAAIGHAFWDIQSAIVLRIGPMALRHFAALLPGRPLFIDLTNLASAYLDGAVTFAINPVLAADAVPPLALTADEDGPGRLGWDTWLGMGGRRERLGDEAIFQPARPEAAEERR